MCRPITGLEKCQGEGEREREREIIDMKKAPLLRRAALKIFRKVLKEKIENIENHTEASECEDGNALLLITF